MLKKSIHTMIITMISRVLGLFRGTLGKKKKVKKEVGNIYFQS